VDQGRLVPILSFCWRRHWRTWARKGSRPGHASPPAGCRVTDRTEERRSALNVTLVQALTAQCARRVVGLCGQREYYNRDLYAGTRTSRSMPVRLKFLHIHSHGEAEGLPLERLAPNSGVGGADSPRRVESIAGFRMRPDASSGTALGDFALHPRSEQFRLDSNRISGVELRAGKRRSDDRSARSSLPLFLPLLFAAAGRRSRRFGCRGARSSS